MSIEVHIDWRGQTHLVGRLYPSQKSSSTAFEYDRAWLQRPDAFAIDPMSLPLRNGSQRDDRLFGAIQDCGPDRWGRLLIERAVRKQVLEARPYQDLDYVLALDDHSRIGALRFRATADGPFLAHSAGRLPPVVRLGALIAAADAIHHDSETADDLRYLLGFGSPVGGARPKSVVELKDGTLALAKFPKPDDIRSIPVGEILALTLARRAGIATADHELVRAAGKDVAIVTRFDRKGPERIPFVSGHTLVGPSGDESYTGLAEAIRQYGHDVTADLRELWRRMIFSLLICNRDDHMRNHGFVMREPGRWALSPAYDLNPVPLIDRVPAAVTPISGGNLPSTVDAALSVAKSFSLDSKMAQAALAEILGAISDWREGGRRLGIASKELNAYATAFEHPVIEEARALLPSVHAVRVTAAPRSSARQARRPSGGYSA